MFHAGAEVLYVNLHNSGHVYTGADTYTTNEPVQAGVRLGSL